jgi:hypothetical protein
MTQFADIDSGLVQEFITHAAIEAFDEGIPGRLARRNEVPVDAVVFAPGQHGVASELGAVVVDKSIQVCRTVRGSA